jgi:host factor-I protein
LAFYPTELAMDTKATPQNIQDAFLNTVRREKDVVTIYLMNGAKLSGRIKSFDKFSVLVESGAQDQLIFKHAISTIIHSRRTSGGGTTGEPRATHASEPQHESSGEGATRAGD